MAGNSTYPTLCSTTEVPQRMGHPNSSRCPAKGWATRPKDGAPGPAIKGRPPVQFHCWREPARRSFMLSHCPFRFNLHSSFAAGGVLAKTTPLPVLRTFTQPALHWVAMDVLELLCE